MCVLSSADPPSRRIRLFGIASILVAVLCRLSLQYCGSHHHGHFESCFLQQVIKYSCLYVRRMIDTIVFWRI